MNRGSPRGPRLFDRLGRPALEALHVLPPDPGADSGGPLGFEGDEVGHSQLGRLLDQPAEPVAVSRAHRQYQGHGPFDPLDLTDLDLPVLADRAFPNQALAVEDPDVITGPDPSHLQVVGLVAGEREGDAG
jgi:hypothetical protein